MNENEEYLSKNAKKKEIKHFKKAPKLTQPPQPIPRPNPTKNYEAIQQMWQRIQELANNERFLLQILTEIGICDMEMDEQERVTYHPNEILIGKLRAILDIKEDIEQFSDDTENVNYNPKLIKND